VAAPGRQGAAWARVRAESESLEQRVARGGRGDDYHATLHSRLAFLSVSIPCPFLSSPLFESKPVREYNHRSGGGRVQDRKPYTLNPKP
jgi:hypothetical protein